MQTASLITPSPKRIANNLGSVSSLIKVKAATESVAEMTDENNKISLTEKLM